jgi:hypothetical protein
VEFNSPNGRHHIAKFTIGQESPPPHSSSKKRNLAKKKQCASYSLVNELYV